MVVCTYLMCVYIYVMCIFICYVCVCVCVYGGSAVKNPPANAGDLGSIPGSGRSPGEGNDNPLQYSCLENPMDGRAFHPWGCKTQT